MRFPSQTQKKSRKFRFQIEDIDIIFQRLPSQAKKKQRKSRFQKEDSLDQFHTMDQWVIRSDLAFIYIQSITFFYIIVSYISFYLFFFVFVCWHLFFHVFFQF